MNPQKELFENIRKIRVMNGYSQEYMASQLNITQRHYSRIERGEVDISWSTICKIADVLKVTPQHIVGLKDLTIFNTVSHQKSGNFYIATEIEYIKILYERLIKEKDEQIKKLETLLKNKK
jgi:transcriptional regulator with XRE-family HTH domain